MLAIAFSNPTLVSSVLFAILASARSAGKTMTFRGRELPVQELTQASFAGVVDLGRVDDDDGVVEIDQVVGGVGEEGVALHRAGPLRRRG